MCSDRKLVRLVLDGRKEAFATLVKRYERLVRAIALGVIGDFHSAEDVAQEAFLGAYRKLSGLNNDGAFGPWLLKIARRCALDARRRKLKEIRPHGSLSETTAAAATDDSTDRQLDQENQRLLAAVGQLPEMEKQALLLHYFLGYNVKEIARIAGQTVGTVTKQLSRARNRLRNILKESNYD